MTTISISVPVIVVHVKIVHLLHVLSYPTRNIVIWLLDQMKRKIVNPGKLFSYFFPPFSCWCSSHKDSGTSQKESLLYIRRVTSWKWPDKNLLFRPTFPLRLCSRYRRLFTSAVFIFTWSLAITSRVWLLNRSLIKLNRVKKIRPKIATPGAINQHILFFDWRLSLPLDGSRVYFCWSHVLVQNRAFFDIHTRFLPISKITGLFLESLFARFYES